MLHKFPPLTALLLVVLLAACAPAPEYGPVVTETSAAPVATSTFTSTPEATFTRTATFTATPRPDALERVLYWANLGYRFAPDYSIEQLVTSICEISTENGCAHIEWSSSYRDESYPFTAEPDEVNARLLFEGVMNGTGLEYQAWEVQVLMFWPPSNKDTETFIYPVFVWKDGEWLFDASPSGWTLETLQHCGQIIYVEPYSLENVREQVYACQTATPTPQSLTPAATP